MNQQIKQKWVDALNSGEYEQQRLGQLHNPDGWCCLGVLCDIYAQEKGIDWEDYDYSESNSPAYILGSSEFLPPVVAEWAEFEPHESNGENRDVMILFNDVPHYLSTLNDSLKYGLDFKGIANLIRKQL